MAIKTELRHLTATELRVAAGKDMVIEGYAAKFNSESNDLGGFREVLAPGCFTRSMKKRDPDDDDYDGDDDNDIKCLADHDGTRLLGRSANKSLKLSCDSTGLRFRCTLNPNLQLHRDIHEAVKTGLMSTCSFAFKPTQKGQHWQDKTTGNETYALRTITDADLYDVSVLGCAPAYPDTEVDARSILAQRGNVFSTLNGGAFTPAELETIRKRVDAAMAQRGMRQTPYTRAEIDAIRAKLMAKVGSTIARAENGQDVDDEVDDEERALAGATYDANAVRSARIENVLNQIKNEKVQKWLKGETPISGK